MNLIDEAVIIEIFGIRMYAFGVYVALGALCAMTTLALTACWLRMKKGTAALTALLSGIFGLICSRVVFCLLNQELGSLTPIHIWPQINSGGWSLFGLIVGVFLGGVISAKILKEKTGRIMDILSLSILPLIAAERIGENRMDYFDISRTLDSSFLKGSFLAVGEDEIYLATYYVAAMAAVILFVAMLIFAARSEMDGGLTIRFLLLFGAVSIITESLRYDFFLSVSFVGLQQVAAALMLALGVILAIRRSNRPKSALAAAAIASIPLMVGAVIGLEFALDRTTWNKILIYILMVITVGIPAGLGMELLSKGNKIRE
ncbi:MAG: prolipoprotein diacylglyceryl transferase [Clostridia bacterium]|nr:prolipoprotein diacylglyceryl transferase [Clostridia bacterium]